VLKGEVNRSSECERALSNALTGKRRVLIGSPHRGAFYITTVSVYGGFRVLEFTVHTASETFYGISVNGIEEIFSFQTSGNVRVTLAESPRGDVAEKNPNIGYTSEVSPLTAREYGWGPYSAFTGDLIHEMLLSVRG